MGYRKFSADQLFTGYELLDRHQVLITDEAGRVEAIVPDTEAGEDVQAFEGILTPGFINAHCHLELSHMKGLIPEQTGMIDFLLAVMTRRYFPDEQVMEAMASAEQEMLENGIVAVGDICNTAHSIPQKQQGRLYYHSFIEATGFVAATAAQRFEAAKAVLDQYRAIPGHHCSLVPHAPYSVSPRLFEMILSLPGNHLQTMHNQESLAENEFIQNGTGHFHQLYQAIGIDINTYQGSGRSSLQTCLPFFEPAEAVILVHNVVTSKEDLDWVQQRSDKTGASPALYFCICPNANLYIGNGLPPVDLLMQANLPIVIGTDSLASNHQLSILKELHTLHQAFPQLPLPTLLQWATLQGARALQVDHTLGSFEKNKQPGILQIASGLTKVKRIL